MSAVSTEDRILPADIDLQKETVIAGRTGLVVDGLQRPHADALVCVDWVIDSGEKVSLSPLTRSSASAILDRLLSIEEVQAVGLRRTVKDTPTVVGVRALALFYESEPSSYDRERLLLPAFRAAHPDWRQEYLDKEF